MAGGKWKLYILECNNGAYYTGITLDLTRRLAEHESGKGAKYLRGKAPFKLLHTESFKTRSLAQTREAKIKSLSKPAKIKLVSKK